MKKLLLAAVVLVALASHLCAFDESELNLVTFTNLTSQTIEYIFLSPGDSDHWGPEILGSARVLERGESLGFYIHYPERCNTFDIMAVGEDGGTFVIYDYDICDDSEEVIELVNKDLTDDPPEMDLVTIEVRNDTIPIYYVFISPADSEYWGVDYLDEVTILDSGDSVTFLFPVGDEPTEYHLMGVDEEGDQYQFRFDVDADTDGLVFPIEVADLVVE